VGRAADDAVLGYNEATRRTVTYTITVVWVYADSLVLAITCQADHAQPGAPDVV